MTLELHVGRRPGGWGQAEGEDAMGAILGYHVRN